MLTNNEVSALLANDKIITQNVRWQATSAKHSENYTLEATVLDRIANVTLKLVGRKGKTNRSFALLYSGEPIKKLTVHSLHRNPDGTLIRGPHKHAWNEIDADRNAYIPDDVSFGDINSEFLGFLKQCNIKLIGAYASIIP